MLRFAIALAALTPFAASAITLDSNALTSFETTVAGEFGYAINLSALGLTEISSVLITDSSARTETGGNTTGFDFDGLVIGTDATDPSTLTAASSYTLQAGGVSGSTTLVGSNNNASINTAFATPGALDGTTSGGFNGFVSLGNNGSITAIFDTPFAVQADSVLFIREIGTNERLSEISFNAVAPVPLPAGGALLVGGVAAFAALRKRR